MSRQHVDFYKHCLATGQSPEQAITAAHRAEVDAYRDKLAADKGYYLGQEMDQMKAKAKAAGYKGPRGYDQYWRDQKTAEEIDKKFGQPIPKPAPKKPAQMLAKKANPDNVWNPGPGTVIDQVPGATEKITSFKDLQEAVQGLAVLAQRGAISKATPEQLRKTRQSVQTAPEGTDFGPRGREGWLDPLDEELQNRKYRKRGEYVAPVATGAAIGGGGSLAYDLAKGQAPKTGRAALLAILGGAAGAGIKAYGDHQKKAGAPVTGGGAAPAKGDYLGGGPLEPSPAHPENPQEKTDSGKQRRPSPENDPGEEIPYGDNAKARSDGQRDGYKAISQKMAMPMAAPASPAPGANMTPMQAQGMQGQVDALAQQKEQLKGQLVQEKQEAAYNQAQGNVKMKQLEVQEAQQAADQAGQAIQQAQMQQQQAAPGGAMPASPAPQAAMPKTAAEHRIFVDAHKYMLRKSAADLKGGGRANPVERKAVATEKYIESFAPTARPIIDSAVMQPIKSLITSRFSEGDLEGALRAFVERAVKKNQGK
jgi:hypothetical protein